jgi:flagellar L-ring protein precursor FlgH
MTKRSRRLAGGPAPAPVRPLHGARRLAAPLRAAVALLLIPVAGGAETVLPARGSLFADHQAHRVGDAITILIVESTEAAKSTLTKTSSETSNSAGSGGRLDFFDFWSLDADNASLGEGSTARRGDLEARLTAKVSEIDANGLLVVEGTRSVLVNGEREEITLRGSVRPQDVAANNTVLSTFLADASIEYSGEGVLASAERPGIVTRIFNWLF